MSRDIREERQENARSSSPAAPKLPNRPVSYPLLLMRHDTGLPNSWERPKDRPGNHVSDRFTAGRGKFFRASNFKQLTYYLVLIDTQLYKGAVVNGVGNNFISEMLHRIGQKRDWQFDLRTRQNDGVVGYLFRDPAKGGLRLANPKLQVSILL